MDFKIIANRVITRPMTSRDLERSGARSRPETFEINISIDNCTVQLQRLDRYAPRSTERIFVV